MFDRIECQLFCRDSAFAWDRAPSILPSVNGETHFLGGIVKELLGPIMHRQFISAGQGRQLAYARNFISITIINLDGIHLLFCLRLWSSNQVRWNRYRPAINSNATYWTLSREKNVRWLSKIHVCKNKHNLLEILFWQGNDASDGIWGLLSKNMPPCWREVIYGIVQEIRSMSYPGSLFWNRIDMYSLALSPTSFTTTTTSSEIHKNGSNDILLNSKK